MTVIGRERELDMLRDALERLIRGEGSLVLLVGEPGIGKTRLADEISAIARARGAVIAWGAAWDGGGAPAWWPWIQILRMLAPSLPPPDERLRRDLGPLWNEHDAAHDGDDAQWTQFRRFDALRAVLQVAAQRAPLLVVLEDLHAADLASLQALHFVARSQRALPVLVIASQRDAEPELGAALVNELARIAREAKVVQLAPLDRAAVGKLMADLDPVREELVDRIFEATGGNPLYASEAIRALRSGVRDFLGGVRVLIGDRLAKLAPAARDALDHAAILGRDVTWNDLAELVGLAEPVVRERLRPAIAAGIVADVHGGVRFTHVADVHGGVRFTHALFRERLVEELAPERARRIHRAAGELLARRHEHGRARCEEVAAHLLAALPAADTPTVVTWAVRAAEETIRDLAFDRAVTMLEQAIATFDRGRGEAAERLDLELRLAEVLARTGAGDRSRAVSVAAANVARGLRDGARMARAALAYGAELRIAIVDPVLIGLLEEALAMVDEQDLALRARVLGRLAAARTPALEPAQPIAEARSALELARASGDDDALMHTLDWAWSAMTNHVAPAERATFSRQLVTRAIARGELVIAQRAYARLAIDAAELCELSELDLAIVHHGQLGNALGHARWRWLTPILRSMRALMVGQWDVAADAQTEAAELVAQIEHPYAGRVLFFHRLAAFKARWCGGLPELMALLQQAPTPQRPAHVAQGNEIMARINRGAMSARFGAIDVARRMLHGISVEMLTPSRDGLYALSEAVIAIGDRERAQQLLPLIQKLEGPAGSWGAAGYVWEGPLSGLVGGLAATLEQWDLAVESFEEALALSVALEARPLSAVAKHKLADALFRRGDVRDRARAMQLLDEALAEARALDQPYLVRAIDGSRANQTVHVARSPDVLSWTMEREGEVWSITCAEGVVRLRHSRALDLLDTLRRSAGQEHHVLDLMAQGETVDAGDAGELLDAEAQRAYRRRIGELERDLAEAEPWNDRGRCDQIRAELELLTDELARAVGLGGRTRRAGNAVERARVNVHKRLRGVIQRIGDTLPGLAAHLATHVKTGTFVGYRIESRP